MKKKTILILISLLHICVFCVGILIFFQTKQTSRENSNLISDAAVRITETESDTLIELSSTESFSTELLLLKISQNLLWKNLSRKYPPSKISQNLLQKIYLYQNRPILLSIFHITI